MIFIYFKFFKSQSMKCTLQKKQNIYKIQLFKIKINSY